MRPKPASSPSPPPRWIWKPSTWSPSRSGTIWPLRPMSATWVRAQELGQPLTLIVMRHVEPVGDVGQPLLQLGDHVGRAGLGLDDRELAELDAGAGHRAAPERARPRRAGRARPAPSTSGSTWSGSTSRTSSFWYGVVRTRPEPCASTMSATLAEHRARDPARPSARRRRRTGRRAARARRCGRSAAPGPEARGRRRAGAAGTRPRAPPGTAPRPSPRRGTSAGPGCAAAGSRSRGRSPTTPAQTSGTSSSGTQAPSRWASIGLVDRPPPTQRSKPGPCSGCTTPRNDDVVGLVHDVGQPGIAVLNLRGRLENSAVPM